MKTLKLFNAVVKKEAKEKPFVYTEGGYVIEPGALWAKEQIIDFYKKEALDGNDLNKTFHKSWNKIKTSTRYELFLHQIVHYLSTYGSNFQGEIYIPKEVVDIPKTKIVFKVIKSYTKDELIKKALGMLQSGVALKEETIDDLLTVLVSELGYKFTGKEGIKNKEAVVKIADLYGVIPQDFLGFFRYILYRTTNSTLLIKNRATRNAIKKSEYNPDLQFHKFGLERLAEHFNRFKPLFLAFKSKCPATINKISKLSKTLHKPMVQNPLNKVTSEVLKKSDLHWLDNATPYALFKALAACHNRIYGQSTFLYKVRNGKSFVKESESNRTVVRKNYETIINHLKGRINLTGKKIFIPEDVVYALPTSEKMFVGNIPMGSKFYGDRLAVGIYWENKWGARDLDLSAMSIDGKTGWDRSYNQQGGALMFSGDITDAPNGAVEYLYASKRYKSPAIVMNNIYALSGDDYFSYDESKEVKFKIIVGRGDDITRNYMMNPNNLFMETTVETVQRQQILGLIRKEGERQSFTIMNFGSGNSQVSGFGEHATLARVALTQEWSDPLSFNEISQALGATLVDKPEEADVDLSINLLERDSFTKLFEEKKELASV